MTRVLKPFRRRFTGHVDAERTTADGGKPVAPRPVLEVRNLSAGYGELPAVRDVSLEVHPGEVVALFGPNGAGKSTTLLATVGALHRMRGDVRWLDRPTTEPLYRLARRGLAFVPEARAIVSGLSTKDNLRLGGGHIDDAVSYFPELKELLDRKAGLLSGGEQQMLSLARALARAPRALIVDELSLGLAPLVVARLLTAIRLAADDEGMGVLLVEQQANRALSVADRWYLMANGTLTRSGDAHASSDDITSAYFNEPKSAI